MAGILDFLNRQISVPEAPNTNTSRTTTYIPDIGEIGFTMDKELSPILKQRLEKMAGSFPHDGMTPEEVGALEAMVELSAQAAESAEAYVNAAEKIGADTVKMYGLEQEHKANFLGYNNQIQGTDVKHINALSGWQSKTDGHVNNMREKMAYLKTKRQVA